MNDGTKINWQDESLPNWYNKNLLTENAVNEYAALFNFRPCDRVLDLDCGEGSLLKIAAHTAQSCVGLDISDAQIALAKEKLAGLNNVQIIKETLQGSSFPAGSFTKISIRNAIHHLTDEQKGVLINKAHSWLDAVPDGGGVFIIQDLITSFALNKKDERRQLIEEQAAAYYGQKWPSVRDAFLTTLYVEYPCDIAQLTRHLLVTGFNILKIASRTCFACTVIAHK